MIHANRRPEDAACAIAMSASDRTWNGGRGLFDGAFLKRVAEGLVAPICYAAGPPTMVQAVQQALNRLGVDDDDVCSEGFAGCRGRRADEGAIRRSPSDAEASVARGIDVTRAASRGRR